MSLTNIAAAATEQLVGRYLRLLSVVSLMALFALIALYHFTVAGMLALEIEVGALYARLIVAGIYTLLTLAGAAILWAMRRKNAMFSPKSEPKPRHIQLAMLIEAVMLDYEVSRRPRKAS